MCVEWVGGGEGIVCVWGVDGWGEGIVCVCGWVGEGIVSTILVAVSKVSQQKPYSHIRNGCYTLAFVHTYSVLIREKLSQIIYKKSFEYFIH